MSLTISEVKFGKSIRSLIEVPWKIYAKDPNWVPPLKMTIKDIFNPKHPFYETSKIKSWVAKKEGKLVGRIVAIINHKHNEFHKEPCGFFGFFDCPDDHEVSSSLLKKAEDYLKSEGMNKVRGPMNPSINYECGTLIDGFNDPPQIMMTYNPAYHKVLLEKEGYKKAKDLLAYRINSDFTYPELIKKAAKRIEKSHNVTYRKLDIKNWDQEVSSMWKIYNSAWEDNWGFIPMTKKEFYHTAKDLKTVVDPSLVHFVDVNKETAGFFVVLPDYNQVFKQIPSGKLLPWGIFKLLRAKKYIDRGRVVILGLVEKYRNTGIASLLYYKMQEDVLKAGLKEVEMSWILEDNFKMRRPLERMGAKAYKTYRIFEKELV
ncbi:hypothetical protein OAK75_10230 [Bacteriovoracales bacterium]|nr:hypothetical protein [Bacteriovoracales bacterium]